MLVPNALHIVSYDKEFKLQSLNFYESESWLGTQLKYYHEKIIKENGGENFV